MSNLLQPGPSIPLQILGYRDDGQWVALALEMDLRGYGQTFDQALDELAGAIEAQIELALEKDCPEILYFPAEPFYFQMYERAKMSALSTFGRPRHRQPDVEARSWEVPASRKVPVAGDCHATA